MTLDMLVRRRFARTRRAAAVPLRSLRCTTPHRMKIAIVHAATGDRASAISRPANCTHGKHPAQRQMLKEIDTQKRERRGLSSIRGACSSSSSVRSSGDCCENRQRCSITGRCYLRYGPAAYLRGASSTSTTTPQCMDQNSTCISLYNVFIWNAAE